MFPRDAVLSGVPPPPSSSRVPRPPGAVRPAGAGDEPASPPPLASLIKSSRRKVSRAQPGSEDAVERRPQQRIHLSVAHSGPGGPPRARSVTPAPLSCPHTHPRPPWTCRAKGVAPASPSGTWGDAIDRPGTLCCCLRAGRRGHRSVETTAQPLSERLGGGSACASWPGREAAAPSADHPPCAEWKPRPGLFQPPAGGHAWRGGVTGLPSRAAWLRGRLFPTVGVSSGGGRRTVPSGP